jgi:integrase
MATLVKTTRGYKAVIRKTGWPTQAKSFDTKRDANAWARQVEVEMEKGVYFDRAGSTKLSIAKALERYEATVTITKKASTQKGERGFIRQAIKELGSYSMAALTTEVVAKYRDEMTARGLSGNTVRLKLALLSNLYNVALREWGVGLIRNPVALVRKPRTVSRDRRLKSDVLAELVGQCKLHSNPMLAWIVQLAIETSMRSGEITGLTLGQVDIGSHEVRLTNTKNGSARTVYLTIKAAELFAQALANPIRPMGCELVFFGEPGKDGKRRPYQFNKNFAVAKKKIGLEDFRFHDLRHEAISRFKESGLSDIETSEISGHKTLQMLKRYAHLDSKHMVKRLHELMK